MPFSSRELLAALQAAGFETVSQRGSHVKLRRQRQAQTHIVVLKHPAREIPEGTFASILKQAGMSRAEFDRLR